MSSIGKRLANYDYSRTRLPTLVNFGPQAAKNRTVVSTQSINFLGRSSLKG